MEIHPKVSNVQQMSKQTQTCSLVCTVINGGLERARDIAANDPASASAMTDRIYSTCCNPDLFHWAQSKALYDPKVRQISREICLQSTVRQTKRFKTEQANVVSAFSDKSFTSEENLLKWCYWTAAEAGSPSLWMNWYPRQPSEKCCWIMLLTDAVWIFSQGISKPNLI